LKVKRKLYAIYQTLLLPVT